jgi:hypothetical protein
MITAQSQPIVIFKTIWKFKISPKDSAASVQDFVSHAMTIQATTPVQSAFVRVKSPFSEAISTPQPFNSLNNTLDLWNRFSEDPGLRWRPVVFPFISFGSQFTVIAVCGMVYLSQVAIFRRSHFCFAGGAAEDTSR